MRNIFLLFLISLFVLPQSACNKRRLPDVAEDYMLGRGLLFYVVDSVTRENLIGRSGEKYHPDSIKIIVKQIGQYNPGVIVSDSIGKYRGAVSYLFAFLPGPEYILPLKFSTEVYVQLNQYEADTFFIDKQSGQGFAYYLNKKHIVTISAPERNYPIFYIKK